MVSIFKMCRKYLIKNKYCVIWYGFLCLTSSIFSMISPYISGNFIDYLIVADDISKIYQYCFVFFGLFVINQLIGYIVNRVYIKMQTQMGYELNSDVIRHIQRLPVSFLKKQNMAYLNQRVNNDSNQLITFCINIVQGILINSLKLLFSISLLVQFSSNITLLFVAIIGAYALSYKILKKILFEAQFILTEAQTNYFSKLFEQFDNILFVKMQAIYESFLSRLKREFQNILKVSLQYQKISYLFSSLDSLVMSLAQIGIFIMGGALVIRGKLSVGQLTIMLSYFGIMMEASRYFFSLTKTIQDNKVAYTRLKQILDLESDENAGVELKDIGQIRLKNIMFYYGKKCIFRDISLEFKKGKIYSIIGKNGIGKSTLVDLIIGFYNREYEGEIYYDDLSLDQIDVYKTRKMCFGICEQEPVLLADTVKYNVSMDGEGGIDLKRLFYIAKKINLYSFIESLPQKLESTIEEKNSNLSGGEKQKLSIMRTFYKNSPVIILDEPTSALDEESIRCLQCLQEAYQMEGDMVRSGKNIHATMIYPFVRMLQEKCRDLTEEQIHKALWKEYEISGADRMFVERASKILEPYEGESEDEK